MPVPSTSTGVAITNPLVLYRSLLATKRIDPDPAQHRLAIHLGKLYDQLIDYEPIVQYGHRLNQISRALGTTPGNRPSENDGRSPLPRGIFSSLWPRKEENDSLALTRVLTNHEAAMQVQSPQGLMLHGEVGTGKSMLIDLFADCLPNRKKRRFHYTTFMLETMAKLEHLRRSRHTIIPASMGQGDDYSLLWLARDLISTSPILFLDEFQLPDRAASKIITNLMTSFFHLGGVLIATSNRMPEELAKAAGMDFAAPMPSKSDSIASRLGMRGMGRSGAGKSGAMFSTKGDFAQFVDVLKARCEIWEMESVRDYRRRESEIREEGAQASNMTDASGFEGLEEMSPGNVGLGFEQSLHISTSASDKVPVMAGLPRHYLLFPGTEKPDSDSQAFDTAYNAALALAFPTNTSSPTTSTPTIPWTPSSMHIYGRLVSIPRQHAGVAHFSFAELCATPLGPADFITLASTYHTLILTEVPILTTLLKNEARRFITLLDALYEARCKLLITAAAGPDDLFFPEQQNPSTSSSAETVDTDATYSETLAEVYQDATAPFRPNISLYDPGVAAPSEPDFTHARLAGMFSEGQLEDEPFHRPARSSSSSSASAATGSIDIGDAVGFAAQDERDIRAQQAAIRMARGGPDFSQAGIFTGEDEKFAFKRARSRLWEMCSERWWARGRDGGSDGLAEEWHKPVAASVRAWERRVDAAAAAAAIATGDSTTLPTQSSTAQPAPILTRDLNEKDDEAMFLFKHNASPFRRHEEPPPKIGEQHVWGVVSGWGKRAGLWGKGPEGVEERRVEKARERESVEEEERAREERSEKEREEKLRAWKKEH